MGDANGSIGVAYSFTAVVSPQLARAIYTQRYRHWPVSQTKRDVELGVASLKAEQERVYARAVVIAGVPGAEERKAAAASRVHQEL